MPVDYVCRLAQQKAATVAGDGIVLGADTVVVVDGRILEKPTDPGDAIRMLRLLQGRTHEVVTGICLRKGTQSLVDSETTMVRFIRLDDDTIVRYVATGEPLDKAGAYAIQGLASKYIDRIEGCYFNVVGLPISLVWRRLRELGYQSTTDPSSS
jgi:septum formation protein